MIEIKIIQAKKLKIKLLKKGECIFFVPKSIILTIEEANNTPLANLIKSEKLLSTMPNVSLALFLLYLRTDKPTSKCYQKWRSYLDILPNEFNTPLYFSLDELKMLQNSQCFSKVYFIFNFEFSSKNLKLDLFRRRIAPL